jgi:hypothetical protein
VSSGELSVIGGLNYIFPKKKEIEETGCVEEKKQEDLKVYIYIYIYIKGSLEDFLELGLGGYRERTRRKDKRRRVLGQLKTKIKK